MFAADARFRSLGYQGMVDPGPPSDSYTCRLASAHGSDHHGQAARANMSASVNARAKSFPSQGTRATTAAMAAATGMFVRGTTTRFTSKLASASVTSRITHHSTDAGFHASQMAGADDPAGPATAVKVSVVLVTLVGVMLLGTLVICLRRHQRQEGDRERVRFPGSCTSSTGQPTVTEPLTSPELGGGKAHIRPPPRLSERRLLPTSHKIPTAERSIITISRSSHLRSTSVRPPAAARLAARQMKRGQASSEGLPSRPSKTVAGPYAPRATRPGSVDSLISSQPSSTSIAEAPASRVSPVATGRRARDPWRRVRSDVPGPPPNRALPATPSSDPQCPATHLTKTWLTSRPRNEGVAYNCSVSALDNPPYGVVLPPESRDLWDLTEKCARESRSSWGTWAGMGGGGTGIAVSSPRRKRGARPVVLEEVDLEELGGTY